MRPISLLSRPFSVARRSQSQSQPVNPGESPSSSGTDIPGIWRSWTITDADCTMAIVRTRPLAGSVPHPGEVLNDELDARGLSANALAIALRLPASRISQIVRVPHGITPETALRL